MAKETKDSFVEIITPDQCECPDARSEGIKGAEVTTKSGEVFFPQILEEEQDEENESLDDENAEAGLPS